MSPIDTMRRAALGVKGALLRPLIGLTAILVLLGVCQSATAAGIQVTQAGSVFPQHAIALSGPGLQGLSAQRVHIVENGESVRALSVRSLRQPSARDFGVVLAIDVSPTAKAIERAVAAARVLAAQRPPGEAFGIVEADASPAAALPLTRDAASIHAALAHVPVISHHGLHVYDAALAGVAMLRSANIASGSVIVLSDGADRGDTAALKQVGASAGQGHIRIFAVGVNSPRFDPETLTALARVSGGKFIKADSSHLSHVFGAIQTGLSNQYLIRYFSAQSAGRRIPASMRIDGIPGTFDISYSPPAVPRTATAPPRPASIWTSTTGTLLMTLMCALLIGAAVMVLVTRRESLAARVGRFITPSVPHALKQRTLVHRALGDPRLRGKDRPRWIDALALEFDVARIKMSPARLGWFTAAGTVLLAWLLATATSSPVAALIALAAPVAVRMGIRFLANRQRRRFDEQLPDNLQVIASALRAGHTFVGSLRVMVEDAPEPSREEFGRALADEALGVPLVDALDQVSKRMESADFQQVTLVATLQRDTGGNTAEVMDLVADTVRDRLDLRRLIRTLTAQGRLAGGILSGLPVALLIAISLIDPGYTTPLFHTTMGIIAVVFAVGLLAAGATALKKIVDIEI